MTNEQAQCAHKRILGKTTKPDKNGYIRDYWICGDCETEMKVEPVFPPTYYLVDKPTAHAVGNVLNTVIQDVHCSQEVKDITHNFNSGLHITDCIPDDFKEQ